MVFGAPWGRAQRDAADELAAFEEEGKLAHRPLQGAVAGALPGGDEAALGEPLGEDDMASAVPEQDLGAPAPATHEDEDAAREHVGAHRRAHDGRERVKGLAHVDRLAMHPDANGAREGDHASLRTSSAMSAIVAPSMRSPAGPWITRAGAVAAACAARISTSQKSAAGMRGCSELWRCHFRSVVALMPISAAVRARPIPSRSRRATSASAARRASAG